MLNKASKNKQLFRTQIEEGQGEDHNEGKDSAFLEPPEPFEMRENPKLKFNSLISIFGKRGTGKTNWIKWYLDNHKDVFPWYYVFTKTGYTQQFSECFPDRYIINGWQPEILDRVLDRQKIARSMFHRGDKINPLCCVIFDDIIGSELTFDHMLQTWCNTSRHAMVQTICASQTSKGFPPVLRKNTDMAVLFRLIDQDDRDTVFGCYGAGCKKSEFFNEYLDKYTDDRGFIAMSNNPDDPISKRGYYGKAPKMGAIGPMGCRDFWRKDRDQYEKIKRGYYVKMDKEFQKAVEEGIHWDNQIMTTTPQPLSADYAKDPAPQEMSKKAPI